MTDFLNTIESILQEKTSLKQICAVSILDLNSNFALPAVVIKLPKESALTEVEILEMTEEFLTDQYKLSGGVFFVDDFPLMSDGKHDRTKMELMANNFHQEQIRKGDTSMFVFDKKRS